MKFQSQTDSNHQWHQYHETSVSCKPSHLWKSSILLNIWAWQARKRYHIHLFHTYFEWDSQLDIVNRDPLSQKGMEHAAYLQNLLSLRWPHRALVRNFTPWVQPSIFIYQPRYFWESYVSKTLLLQKATLKDGAIKLKSLNYKQIKIDQNS